MKGVGRTTRQFVRNVPAAIMALCVLLLASQALAGDSPLPWSARPLMSDEAIFRTMMWSGVASGRSDNATAPRATHRRAWRQNSQP